MAIYRKEVDVCKCNRCGFEWIPRHILSKPDSPELKRCGNRKCNSPYWNKERVRGV